MKISDPIFKILSINYFISDIAMEQSSSGNIDETAYSSKKSFKTLMTLLILGIIGLLVAVFVPSDFVSFIGIFLFLAALYLILYGGYLVYKAMKDPKIKEGKIGMELIIPIILVIIGFIIIVLVST